MQSLIRLATAATPSPRLKGWLVALAQRLGTPPSGTFRVRRGLQMELDPRQYVDRMIFFHCFEDVSVRLFLQHLKTNDVVLDIGANIGYYALVSAAAVGPGGRVIAFEPSPEVARKLRRNILLNGLTNIEVRQVAVSDEAGETALSWPEDNTAHASLKQGSASWVSTAVRTERLDDHLDEFGSVAAIKLDIEGAEYAAIKGAARLLAQRRPAVLMEVNGTAASRFGRAKFDALEQLLQLSPGRLVQATGTTLREVTLAQLKRDPEDSFNVLICP